MILKLLLIGIVVIAVQQVSIVIAVDNALGLQLIIKKLKIPDIKGSISSSIKKTALISIAGNEILSIKVPLNKLRVGENHFILQFNGNLNLIETLDFKWDLDGCQDKKCPTSRLTMKEPLILVNLENEIVYPYCLGSCKVTTLLSGKKYRFVRQGMPVKGGFIIQDIEGSTSNVMKKDALISVTGVNGEFLSKKVPYELRLGGNTFLLQFNGFKDLNFIETVNFKWNVDDFIGENPCQDQRCPTPRFTIRGPLLLKSPITSKIAYYCPSRFPSNTLFEGETYTFFRIDDDSDEDSCITDQ